MFKLFPDVGAVSFRACVGFGKLQITEPFKVLGQGNLEIISNANDTCQMIAKIVASVNSFLLITLAAIFVASLKRQYKPL